jgi:transposase-like protein
MEMNLSTLAKHFSDEAAAWELVEAMRWPDGPVCPHCGDRNRAYFIKPRNGTRTTSTGRVTHRRLWKCKACKKQFSVLVGTIFERSQVPLSKWLLALYLMSASKNGVAANELRRTLDVTQPTAWFMLHRLREAMRLGTTERFTGTVVADEAYIGGDPKNRHAWKKVGGKWQRNTSKDGRGTDKAPVVSLISEATGEIRSRVIANVDGMTLGRFILHNADPTGGTLVTDKWKGYLPIGEQFAKHERVDHELGEYVRDGFSTNRLECFYSQLKSSLTGTHHHVSVEHLQRYVDEHDFRYSTCKMSDTARMARIMEQAEGRRLTYRRALAA